MKRLLLACWLGVATCGAWAAPFSEVTFDAAGKLAADSGKIVLIDFYTTWCGPCKLLDKNTWTDPAVIKLLGEKTVALRLDAEKETALSARYKIAAYPTVLLLKSDGTEIDRLVGYRDPTNFIADFTATLNGKDSLSRAKEKLDAAGKGDAMARMQYGRALAQKGKDAEALQEYLWCFDHGLETTPSFTAVRLSFLLNDIKNLAAHCPAAKEALASRRDERQAKVMAGSTDYQTVVDLISLNGALGQKEKNLAVLDKLPANGKTRAMAVTLMTDQLLIAKRYADVLNGTDGKSAFEQKVRNYNSVIDKLNDDRAKSTFRGITVATGAHYFEALAGLKRNGEGRDLAQQILQFDSSPATRDQLAQAATRAENADLAKFVRQ